MIPPSYELLATVRSIQNLKTKIDYNSGSHGRETFIILDTRVAKSYIDSK